MYKSVLTTANHSKERQSIIDVPDKKGMHNRRRSDVMKAGEKENATGSVVMPPTRQIILPSLSSTFQSKNKVIGIKRMTSGSSNGGWQAPQANVVKKQPIVGYRKDNQAGSESSQHFIPVVPFTHRGSRPAAIRGNQEQQTISNNSKTRYGLQTSRQGSLLDNQNHRRRNSHMDNEFQKPSNMPTQNLFH